MHGSFHYSVKLSIKSFRVPELFVEIPATATVGSLKVFDFFFFPIVFSQKSKIKLEGGMVEGKYRHTF